MSHRSPYKILQSIFYIESDFMMQLEFLCTQSRAFIGMVQFELLYTPVSMTRSNLILNIESFYIPVSVFLRSDLVLNN